MASAFGAARDYARIATASDYDAKSGAIGQGDTGLVEQSQPFEYSPDQGWVSARKWIGPIRSAASMAAQQLAFNPMLNVTITPKEPNLAELTISQDSLDTNAIDADGNGEPVLEGETWALQGQDMEKSIWSHPEFTALEAFNDAPNNANCYEWIRERHIAVSKSGEWRQELNAIPSGAGDGKLAQCWALLSQGVESYSVSQWVLSRSGTVNSQMQGTFVHGRVGNQLTLAQMYGLEYMPPQLRFGIPAGVWVKRTPSYTWEGTKMQFSVEYWHSDSASPILYPYA